MFNTAKLTFLLASPSGAHGHLFDDANREALIVAAKGAGLNTLAYGEAPMDCSYSALQVCVGQWTFDVDKLIFKLISHYVSRTFFPCDFKNCTKKWGIPTSLVHN